MILTDREATYLAELKRALSTRDLTPQEMRALELIKQNSLEKVSPKLEVMRQPSRIKIAQGGRASGAKSHSFASLILQECNRSPKRVACLREIQLSLEESVYRLMVDKIAYLRYPGWTITKEYLGSPNGSRIIFRGLKDLRAAQSIKGLEDYDIFWIDEGSTVSGESLDILMPTIVRKESAELWISYNPETDEDPVTVRFWNSNRPDMIRVRLEPGKVDNPFWSDSLTREMNEDFARDPDLADHVWNGHPRKQGSKSVMNRPDIRSAMSRNIENPEGVEEIGIDVARFGDDKTCMYRRVGMKVVDFIELSGQDTQEVARRAWDMAGRKKDVKIKVDDTGVGCITGNTKILTENGWMTPGNIKEGDRVYSRDMFGNMCLETVRSNIKREPTRIINCDGYEYSFSHILPYKTRTKYPFKQNSWENILSRKYIIFDSEFRYESDDKDFCFPEHSITMPNGGKKVVWPSLDINGKDFCTFLGWYISEGSFWDKDGSINICQTKNSNFKEIETIMSIFGNKVKKSEGRGFSITNRGLYNWIRKNCYKDGLGFRYKTIPRFVANNSKENIEAFLDAFCKGDGFIKNDKRHYLTSSKWLPSDLIELISKIGGKAGVYKKYDKGSIGNIDGRTITRTQDNYCIFEYQQKIKEYNRCVFSEKRMEYIDNVYEISITGETKLFVTMCENMNPIWTHNGGVSDKLKDLGANVIMVNFGMAAKDMKKYTTVADELWFEFPIKDADIPDDPQLMQELAGRQYAYTSHDQRKIEPKKDFKKRYGRSPDRADALLLCFYNPEFFEASWAF